MRDVPDRIARTRAGASIDAILAKYLTAHGRGQVQAFLWMMLSGMSFACMVVFVKLGSAHFSSIEMLFYRSIVGLALVTIPVVRYRLPINTPYKAPQVSRALITMFGLILYFYVIQYLPL